MIALAGSGKCSRTSTHIIASNDSFSTGMEITSDNIVKVRLKGACGCCPMAAVTMQQGIVRVIKEEVPEVKDVQSVD